MCSCINDINSSIYPRRPVRRLSQSRSISGSRGLMSLGGLVMLFSSEIVSPVEKIEHSKGSREEDPGEDVYLLSREFVILAPEGQSVTGKPGGQYGS